MDGGIVCRRFSTNLLLSRLVKKLKIGHHLAKLAAKYSRDTVRTTLFTFAFVYK